MYRFVYSERIEMCGFFFFFKTKMKRQSFEVDMNDVDVCQHLLLLW